MPFSGVAVSYSILGNTRRPLRPFCRDESMLSMCRITGNHSECGLYEGRDIVVPPRRNIIPVRLRTLIERIMGDLAYDIICVSVTVPCDIRRSE